MNIHPEFDATMDPSYMGYRWLTRDHREFAVQDMSTDHIAKAMTMLLRIEIMFDFGYTLDSRTSRQRRLWITRFRAELLRRMQVKKAARVV